MICHWSVGIAKIFFVNKTKKWTLVEVNKSNNKSVLSHDDDDDDDDGLDLGGRNIDTELHRPCVRSDLQQNCDNFLCNFLDPQSPRLSTHV